MQNKFQQNGRLKNTLYLLSDLDEWELILPSNSWFRRETLTAIDASEASSMLSDRDMINQKP